MSYQVETPGQTIGSNCFADSYKGVLSLQTPQAESNLGIACTSGLGSTIEVAIDEEASFASSAVTITTNTVSVNEVV